MEVNFYQVAEGNLIPSVIKLLEKIYTSGLRCIFFSPVEERVQVVDKTLWTFSTGAFIPHGRKSLGFCDKQPIYFTSQHENPNNATVIVLVDTLDYKEFNNFEKIIMVFEEKRHIDTANVIYDNLKKNAENVNYWKQGPKGWVKQV
jgi:DNA polymerase-3 subunit chi